MQLPLSNEPTRVRNPGPLRGEILSKGLTSDERTRDTGHFTRSLALAFTGPSVGVLMILLWSLTLVHAAEDMPGAGKLSCG